MKIHPDNGVIHEINCVMFVQPSLEDDRLTNYKKINFHYFILYADRK